MSTFTDPQPTNRLNSPSHSSIESAQNTALEEIQAAVGTDSSVIGTIIGDLRNTNSNGGGHVQTANKGGTGQTSYSKADLLVAQSSSVLSKLSVGADNFVLTADSTQATGLKWATGNVKPTVRTYSSTLSFWFKPSVISYAVIKVQAQGGTGGTGNDGANIGGAGGGGGGYAEKVVAAANLPAAASVLSLGGGTGSILSYFGSVLSASGGQNASGTTPGDGGTGFSGDFNLKGSAGNTHTGQASGTTGGSAHLGGGGIGATTSGGAGGNYGGGGGGGGENGGQAGGVGAPGIVIIYEY